MNNPYVNREITDDAGNTEEKLFAYGNFCGMEHPVLYAAGENGGSLTDLQLFWPPVDELDTLCYAHDSCHQQLYPETSECDVAIYMILDTALEKTANAECFNLMHDMKGGLQNRAFPMSLRQNALDEISLAIGNRIALGLTRETEEYPEEGDCVIPRIGDSDNVVDSFLWTLMAYWMVTDAAPRPIAITGASFVIQKKTD